MGILGWILGGAFVIFCVAFLLVMWILKDNEGVWSIFSKDEIDDTDYTKEEDNYRF